VVKNLKLGGKKRLNEMMGVPDNIYETALELYELLDEKLSKANLDDLTSEDGETFNLKSNFRISDFNFNNVEFSIKIERHTELESNEFIISKTSITVENKFPSGDDVKRKNVKNDYLIMRSIILAPIDFTMEEFLNFFHTKKNEMVNTLSHELMHAYDHYKSNYDSSYERSRYEASAGRRFGIPAVNSFLHNLYYISAIENLVRPTEVLSDIKLNKINQKEFLNFLLKHETYTTLKKISKFTLEGFKSELKKEMDNIDELFKHLKIYRDDMSDDDKINEVLRLVFVNILNWRADSFRDLITSSFIEKIMGFSGEKGKVFDKFINSIRKFKTPESFFEYEGENFRLVANKMIKKLSKLYDLAEKNEIIKSNLRRV
jgi:hypothetical protein